MFFFSLAFFIVIIIIIIIFNNDIIIIIKRTRYSVEQKDSENKKKKTKLLDGRRKSYRLSSTALRTYSKYNIIIYNVYVKYLSKRVRVYSRTHLTRSYASIIERTDRMGNLVCCTSFMLPSELPETRQTVSRVDRVQGKGSENGLGGKKKRGSLVVRAITI